jgi:hypothetical protein
LNEHTGALESTIDVGGDALAAGAGSVRVAQQSTKTVLRIDPASGDEVETIQLPRSPNGIAVAGGQVW